MVVPPRIQFLSELFLDGGFSQEQEKCKEYGVSLITPIGKPGCGKGTLLDALDNFFELQRISTGDIFRNPHKADCFFSKQADALVELCQYFVIEQKQLLPDDLTTKAFGIYLLDKLEKKEFDPTYSVVADVFPRTMGQYKLTQTFAPVDYFIFIDVDDFTSLDRQRSRAKLQNRPDNGQEHARLDEYRKVTVPLVSHIKSNGRTKHAPARIKSLYLNGVTSKQSVLEQFLRLSDELNLKRN